MLEPEPEVCGVEGHRSADVGDLVSHAVQPNDEVLLSSFGLGIRKRCSALSHEKPPNGKASAICCSRYAICSKDVARGGLTPQAAAAHSRMTSRTEPRLTSDSDDVLVERDHVLVVGVVGR